MQLQRVYYELYESDLQLLESRAWAVPHELDGQARLEFFDTSAIYVSAIHCRDSFCAHYRGASHFANPLPFERDVSDHPLWTPLIGSSINLAVIDDFRQVIAIRSPTRCVYCCSYEAGSWEADQLTICRSLPRPPPDKALAADRATARSNRLVIPSGIEHGRFSHRRRPVPRS